MLHNFLSSHSPCLKSIPFITKSIFGFHLSGDRSRALIPFAFYSSIVLYHFFISILFTFPYLLKCLFSRFRFMENVIYISRRTLSVLHISSLVARKHPLKKYSFTVLILFLVLFCFFIP